MPGDHAYDLHYAGSHHSSYAYFFLLLLGGKCSKTKQPKTGDHNSEYGKSSKDLSALLIRSILRIKVFIQEFIFKRQLRKIFFPYTSGLYYGFTKIAGV